MYIASSFAVTRAYGHRRVPRRWPWSIDPETPTWTEWTKLAGILLMIVGSSALSSAVGGGFLYLGAAVGLSLIGRTAVRWLHNRRRPPRQELADRQSQATVAG